MKRLSLLFVVLAACSVAQEPGSTTTSATDATTTTQQTTSSSTDSVPSTTTTTLAPFQGLGYREIGSKMSFPVQVTASPGSETAYVITKNGRIWALINDKIMETPVLDISDRVKNSGEQGLLAMAIHPVDQTRFFLHYSGDDGRTVVSEFAFDSATKADPASERVLLEVSQPAANHNGGMIQFDPDGSLILGLGDGGGANDTFGNGQDTSTLLGGLVRIDVDSAESSLFDYGLRNPWRFWIDGEIIYIADVGQGTYEEISIVELQEGLNFGWPITEGLHCFQASGCDTAGLTLPLIEVNHNDAGTCSITGGIVYYGSLIPEISGEYFYSDYCGGYLRSLRFEDGEVQSITDWNSEFGVPIPGSVTGFGQDGAGEMYVTTGTDVLKVVAVR